MLKKRYLIFVVCVFIMLTAVSARFFYFSVIKNESLKSSAFSQQTVSVRVQNIRGNICDRNMIKLTNNFESDMYLDSDGNLTRVKSPFVFRDTLRYSPFSSACHIIGHTNAENKGVCGIEKAFDKYLSTDDFSGVSYFSDAVGCPVGEIKKHTAPNTADTVVLTLDSHIQKIAGEVMKKYISAGAAVIMDAESFDILAVVSIPGYNALSVENYMNSEKGELLNRAFMAYDAGSVFKIVTSAAAFNKNPLYHSRDFWCGGMFLKDSAPYFECHKKEGHGFLTMKDAFAKSCNCAFYETGLCTGASDICDTARAFGLGSRVLNISIEEKEGNIPEKDFYTEYETMNLSIGQGEILITPLQCTVMCATVANMGVRKQVNLVKSVVSENGEEDISYYNNKVCSSINPTVAVHIGNMMREAVLCGTASGASQSKVNIAGKTGSAQTGWLGSDGSFKVHGWFCGFFPYENPKYAMTVFCENGKSGAESCVAPFMEIAEGIMEIYPD